MITASQLYNVLACYKAEKDQEGKFLVRGNLTSFMGAGEEFVFDESAEYFANGCWHSLLAAVSTTSYYLPVQVF